MQIARRARLARLLIAWVAWGCAEEAWVASADGFQNREFGYRIARPAAEDPGAASWERAELPGAELAFRRAGATMSFQRRCQLPAAPPSILARHLVIGLEPREFVQAGPLELAARPGWGQVYELQPQDGGAALRLETVTVVEAGCALDWLLVATPGDSAAARDFDRWWRGFEFESDVAAGAAEPAP